MLSHATVILSCYWLQSIVLTQVFRDVCLCVCSSVILRVYQLLSKTILRAHGFSPHLVRTFDPYVNNFFPIAFAWAHAGK